MNHSCFSFQYISIHELPSYRITLSVIIGITSVTAVTLNTLILYSIWKNPSLHKPSYLLLANLALTDLAFGAIEDTVIMFVQLAYIKKWRKIYCYIAATSHLIGYWLASISLYTLTLISIDRFLAIRLKNRYRSFVTSRRIWMVTVPYWIGMLLLLLTVLFLDVLEHAIDVVSPVTIFVFLTTITVCYSKAFHSLKKLTSSVSSSSQQADDGSGNFNVSQYRRSMNTMILVMLTILLFYLPSICSVVIYAILKEFYPVLSYQAVEVSELVVAINSSVNPVIYLWRMQDIRQAVKTTVKRILRREQHSVQDEQA